MRVLMTVTLSSVILATPLTRWAYGCVIFEMLMGTPPFGDRKFVRPSLTPLPLPSRLLVRASTAQLDCSRYACLYVCTYVCVCCSEMAKEKVINRILCGCPHIPRTVSKEARSLIRGESREPHRTPAVTGSYHHFVLQACWCPRQTAWAGER